VRCNRAFHEETLRRALKKKGALHVYTLIYSVVLQSACCNAHWPTHVAMLSCVQGLSLLSDVGKGEGCSSNMYLSVLFFIYNNLIIIVKVKWWPTCCAGNTDINSDCQPLQFWPVIDKVVCGHLYCVSFSVSLLWVDFPLFKVSLLFLSIPFDEFVKFMCSYCTYFLDLLNKRYG
jgi:hypothetical protein